MKKLQNRALACLLALCMLLSALPVEIFAQDTEGSTLPFSDLSDSAWYTEAVCYVYESHLMDGVAPGRFAPDELLPEMLGLRAGAVSPLGLVHDPEKKVTLVIDRALRGYEYLGFHPCENTATVVLRGEDFFNGFLPKLGRVPVELEQVI